MIILPILTGRMYLFQLGNERLSRCYAVQFSSNLQRNVENEFVAVAKIRCYIVQRDLSNLQRFAQRKPAGTRTDLRAGVGGRSDSQRETHALENCIVSCWRGVTLCSSGCKLLRLVRKAELTGFCFV